MPEELASSANGYNRAVTNRECLGRGIAVGTGHVTVLYKATTNKTENVIFTTDNAQFGQRINTASADLHFLTFKMQQEIRKSTRR